MTVSTYLISPNSSKIFLNASPLHKLHVPSMPPLFLITQLVLPICAWVWDLICDNLKI